MIEVEIKVRILDPAKFRKNFEDKNGKYKLSLIHEDTYFNMPNELRNFKETDEALRVRKSIEFTRNQLKPKDITYYYITYKGKKIDSSTKTRRELETKVSHGEKMKEMLKQLGFQEIYTVKKERELYEFKFKGQSIEALIDYIPILKEHFIEVEIMSESNEKLEKYRELLFEFLEQFGVKKEESITKSYLELIADRFGSKVIR